MAGLRTYFRVSASFPHCVLCAFTPWPRLYESHLGQHLIAAWAQAHYLLDILYDFCFTEKDYVPSVHEGFFS